MLLTIFAGAIRFYQLSDHPPIWLDEAYTFGRVAAGWDDMFAILKNDGFPPLHYIIYWWLGKHYFLTPFMLRLLPAVTGTLLAPAMYFLARQMTGKKAALLAAAFTACSVYMLVFSRDAKMYMEAWLAITLFAGGLMWWLRSKSWWAFYLRWPLWVLAGAAAVWLHGTALIVLGLAPLWVATCLRRPWWRGQLTALWFVLGAAIITAGPFWYYNFYNKWNQHSGGIVRDSVATEDSDGPGDWGRSGLTWIDMMQRGPGGREPPTGLEMTRHSASTLLLGWEWPNKAELEERAPASGEYIIPREVVFAASSFMALLAILGVLGALPWPERWRGTGLHDPPGQPWWRTALWLGIWIVLPTYGFYCRSVIGFVSPGYWLHDLWAVWGWRWCAFLGGAAVLAAAMTWFRWLAWTLTAAALVPWPFLVKIAVTQGKDDWFSRLIELLWSPWVLGAITLLAPALIWYHSAPTVRRRMVKLAQGVAVAAGLLLLLWGLYWFWHRQWLDLVADPDLAKRGLTPESQWKAVWWPRYIAVIFPALAVGLAILLMRLPGRPLRWAAIAVVLGGNLVNGGARIVLDTDPRWDLISADYWASEPNHRGAYIVGYNIRPNGTAAPMDQIIGPPGTLLEHVQGRYYYCLQAHLTPPRAERSLAPMMHLIRNPRPVPVNRLGERMRDLPEVTTLFVWERFAAGVPQPVEPQADPYLKSLGPEWRLESVQTHQVFQHWSRISREWNWQQRGWLRRRVYVKLPAAAPPLFPLPPTTRPITPTTRPTDAGATGSLPAKRVPTHSGVGTASA